jgi:hypothetical protein
LYKQVFKEGGSQLTWVLATEIDFSSASEIVRENLFCSIDWFYVGQICNHAPYYDGKKNSWELVFIRDLMLSTLSMPKFKARPVAMGAADMSNVQRYLAEVQIATNYSLWGRGFSIALSAVLTPEI